MNDNINKAPVTYEDWLNLGRVIIPCDTKQAVVEKWSDPDFKITKEEWRIEHTTKQIGLRLDQYIDFDMSQIDLSSTAPALATSQPNHVPLSLDI